MRIITIAAANVNPLITITSLPMRKNPTIAENAIYDNDANPLEIPKSVSTPWSP